MRSGALCILLAAAAFTGCTVAGDAGLSTQRPATIASRASTTLPAQTPQEPGERPRIEIGRNEKVLAVLNENLDSDPDIEQVIAVKNLDDISSPVSIMAADSNSAKGRYYFKSWESSSSSNSARFFDISLKDIVGDHGMEIVFFGMDELGKQTLDIFKKTPPLGSPNLVFSPVCRIAADEIKIEEIERSQSYSMDQKNGDSFPIISYLKDTSFKNSTDMIRTVHTWDYGENQYIAGAPERVLREKLDQKRMETLYAAEDPEALEAFVEGSWILLEERAGAGKRPRVLEIMTLDRKLRRISRFLGDTEEIYFWKESTRVGRGLLFASCKNIDVNTISRTISLRAASVNSLEITVSGADLGDSNAAVYLRITDEVRQEYLGREGPSPSALLSTLDGVYRSINGISIAFDGDRLRWSSPQSTSSGAYIVFPVIDSRVMTVRLLDKDGIPSGESTYLFEGGAGKLTLTPIRLTVKGFEEAPGEPIVLEREENPPAG